MRVEGISELWTTAWSEEKVVPDVAALSVLKGIQSKKCMSFEDLSSTTMTTYTICWPWHSKSVLPEYLRPVVVQVPDGISGQRRPKQWVQLGQNGYQPAEEKNTHEDQCSSRVDIHNSTAGLCVALLCPCDYVTRAQTTLMVNNLATQTFIILGQHSLHCLPPSTESPSSNRVGFPSFSHTFMRFSTWSPASIHIPNMQV